MRCLLSRTKFVLPLKGIIAFVAVLVPPLVFEKYTFYLYLTNSSNFFGYSGTRLWFDIGYFALAGVFSSLIIGRKRWVSILPPTFGAAIFTIAIYISPFCPIIECYFRSPDGLSPLRDFLLFTSLGILGANSLLLLDKSSFKKKKSFVVYICSMGILISYALSFFPLVHIFAGVSVPYPMNYMQWVLGAAVPGFAGSFMVIEASRNSGIGIPASAGILVGFLGVTAGLFLDIFQLCEACSGYESTISSVLLVALVSSMLGAKVAVIATSRTKNVTRTGTTVHARLIMALMIVGTILLLIGFYYSTSYTATVVNSMGSNIANESFSPVEVGSSFVYSGGYLAMPEVRPTAVGVDVNFGNSSISGYPTNFLAAGIGDQSPNCCTDGVDLAYRADAVLFANGTSALFARTWWACDVNMACGGYSWQQLLHFGEFIIPRNTLGHWVDLQMNWTSPTLVGWYYRVQNSQNGTTGPWIMYNSFSPPKIDNHYFDAGVCCSNVFFLQFGISSAQEIPSDSWSVDISCPSYVLGGAWICVPHAKFVGGDNSLWKLVYTWGETYRGLNFEYLGNYTVRFFSSGSSPKDGTVIW